MGSFPPILQPLLWLSMTNVAVIVKFKDWEPFCGRCILPYSLHFTLMLDSSFRFRCPRRLWIRFYLSYWDGRSKFWKNINPHERCSLFFVAVVSCSAQRCVAGASQLVPQYGLGHCTRTNRLVESTSFIVAIINYEVDDVFSRLDLAFRVVINTFAILSVFAFACTAFSCRVYSEQYRGATFSISAFKPSSCLSAKVVGFVAGKVFPLTSLEVCPFLFSAFARVIR